MLEVVWVPGPRLGGVGSLLQAGVVVVEGIALGVDELDVVVELCGQVSFSYFVLVVRGDGYAPQALSADFSILTALAGSERRVLMAVVRWMWEGVVDDGARASSRCPAPVGVWRGW